MDTQLTPDAVEALAKSLAAKLEAQRKDQDYLEGLHKKLADQMTAFHANDAKFKDEIRGDLKALRTASLTLPSVAIAVAAISLAVSLYLGVVFVAFQHTTTGELHELKTEIHSVHGQP